MRTKGRVVHGPSVRLLCVGVLAVGGVTCLGFVAALPWLLAGDGEVPAPENWLDGLGDWWPIAAFLAGAGVMQLVFAGWGLWSWGDAEGAG